MTTQNIFDLVDTWASGGGPYTSIKMNATDNDSASASLLMDLRVGGASKFSVDKSGKATFAATSTVTAPSIMIAGGGGNSGFASTNGYDYFYTRAGSPMAAFSFQQFSIGNGTIAWASSVGTTADVHLTRRAAANLRLGAADAAASVPQTLSVQSVVAGTTDTAGANLTITGSQGTGSGVGGDIIFEVAPAGAAPTVQNTLATALRVYNNKTVALGAAYTVATLPAAGTQGRRAWVTDATTPTFLGTLTGGGAVVTPVFDNGTAWVSA